MDAKGSRSVTPDSAAARNWLLRDNYPRLILQLVEAAVGYHLSRCDPLNLRVIAFAHTRLHRALMRHGVLNHIYKRSGTVMLNRRRGNNRRLLQCISHEPR